MKRKISKNVKRYILAGVGLTFILLVIGRFIPLLQYFRIIAGSVYVLFLPGFILTYVFFRRREIDTIERIALSFGLSIAVVPLAIFSLNQVFNMSITTFSSVAVIGGIIVLGLIGYWYIEKTRVYSLQK